jgi:hypothetical protein
MAGGLLLSEWFFDDLLPCAAGSFRGCGKVGILLLDFHFSMARCSSAFPGFFGERGEAVEPVGMWKSRRLCEISKERWEGWKTCFWFSRLSSAPSFPQSLSAPAFT